MHRDVSPQLGDRHHQIIAERPRFASGDESERRNLDASPLPVRFGRDNPTTQTPASPIASEPRSVHDAGMQSLTGLLADTLLDPVVLASAFAVSAALISGLAARVLEVCEERVPRRTVRPT